MFCLFQELERQENVMVIAHQAVTRCLLAYFLDKDSGMIEDLKINLEMWKDSLFCPLLILSPSFHFRRVTISESASSHRYKVDSSGIWM